MGKNRLLRRDAASAYLREMHGLERAAATLAKLAVSGCGPVFRRDGRVPLYSTADLDAWAASVLSPPTRSSSEATVCAITAAPRSEKSVGISEQSASHTAREGHGNA
jgi:hypothetical protein